MKAGLSISMGSLTSATLRGWVFADQLPGVREDRPGLAALLGYARAGDIVVMVALDPAWPPRRPRA